MLSRSSLWLVVRDLRVRSWLSASDLKVASSDDLAAASLACRRTLQLLASNRNSGVLAQGSRVSSINHGSSPDLHWPGPVSFPRFGKAKERCKLQTFIIWRIASKGGPDQRLDIQSV